MNKENIETYSSSRGGGFHSFAVAALPLVRHILGQKGMVSADLLAMWEQIVGEETAAYTFPEKLDFPCGQKNNGVLRLKVPGGAFALEISHREKFIVEKINAYFGYNAVCSLKIIQDPNMAVQMIVNRKTSEKQKTLVSEEEQNYIVELTDEIANAGLKENLMRLGKSIFNKNHK